MVSGRPQERQYNSTQNGEPDRRRQSGWKQSGRCSRWCTFNRRLLAQAWPLRRSFAASGQAAGGGSPVMAASSSSGPAAKAQKDDGDAKCCARPQAVYTQRPLEGMVFVDQVTQNTWQLTNVVTYERKQLPASWVELVFDHGSGGAAVSLVSADGTCNVQDVEELLKIEVYEEEGTNAVFICTPGSSKPFSVTSHRCKHKVAKLKLHLTSSNQSTELAIFLFKRPRVPNQVVYWSLLDLYHILGMRSYKGVPSKWAWNIEKKTGIKMQQIYNSVQWCLGTYVSDEAAGKKARPQCERCLPAPSVSTVCLLELLVRWAFATRERAGVGDVVVKRHSTQLLDRLLEASIRNLPEPASFVIVPRADWMPLWPRPLTNSDIEEGFKVRILPTMRVDLKGLLDQVLQSPRLQPQKQWWAELKLVCSDQGVCNVTCLMKQLAGKSQLDGFRAQLLLKFSWILEKHMGLVVQGKFEGVMEGLELEVQDASGTFWTGSKEHKLLEYVQACRTASRNVQYLNITTDKGLAGNLPLQFTFITIKGNLGVVCCPQVVLGTPFGSRLRAIGQSVMSTETGRGDTSWSCVPLA